MDYVIQVPSQLSSHLRALRKAKNLSQADLGIRLGLSQTRIARIEGDPLSISVEQLLRVISALGARVALEPLPSIHGTLVLPNLTAHGTVTESTTPAIPEGGKGEDW